MPTPYVMRLSKVYKFATSNPYPDYQLDQIRARGSIQAIEITEGVKERDDILAGGAITDITLREIVMTRDGGREEIAASGAVIAIELIDESAAEIFYEDGEPEQIEASGVVTAITIKEIVVRYGMDDDIDELTASGTITGITLS